MSQKQHLLTIILCSTVLLMALLLSGERTVVAQQSPPSGSTSVGEKQEEQDNVRFIQIDSIGGQPVSQQDGVVLESLHEIGGKSEGIDVVIGGYGVRTDEGEQIWLFTKAQGAQEYVAFGPAIRQKRNGIDTWVVADVALPLTGAPQKKHFLFRAAVLAKSGNPAAVGQSPVKAKNPLETAITLSSPATPVAVLKWVGSSDITIDTIGGQSIEPGTETAVEVSADVTGMRTVSQGTAQGSVYLLVHPVNSNVWRVVGPAEEQSGSWICRDVSFSVPGEPHWRYMDVFAFVTMQSLKPGPIDFNAYLKEKLAASLSIRLYVKDAKIPEPQKTPTVTFTQYVTPEGVTQRLGKGQDTVDLKDVEFALHGAVQDLPQGKNLWVVLNPVNTSWWIVQPGPAILADGKWIVPRIRLEAPGKAPSESYHLYVVASDKTLQEGILDYADLQSRSDTISNSLIVTYKTNAPTRANISSLAIKRVGGREVNTDGSVGFSGSGAVEIEADGVPSTSQIWVGKNIAGTDEWTFVPAMRVDDSVWRTTTLEFGEAVQNGGNSVSDKVINLVAIVTKSPLPVSQGDFNYWRPYAWAISPTVTVAPGTAGTLTALSPANDPASTGGWPLPWWLLILLLIGLIALEYFFRVVSMIAKETQTIFEGIYRYIKAQIQDTPKPHAVRSTLGLVLLGLGIFAIIGYFPIYQHVLSEALGLPHAASHSLALLLIIFVGLTGIIADITSRFGRGDEPQTHASEPTSANDSHFVAPSPLVAPAEPPRTNLLSLLGYVFWMTLLVLIALALLGFNGILYFEFYKNNAAEGSQIPFAFGAAAVFIAGIEILNFYWATRLALDFIVWFFVHVFLLAPPYIIAKMAALIATIFQALPSRQRTVSNALPNNPNQQQAGGSSQNAVSPEDARRIANVYILTQLGDHLKPDIPDLVGNSWHIRVLDKQSEQEMGLLLVDHLTGAASWIPSASPATP